MKIGFNLMPYSPGKHGGAEIYFRNVIANIQKYYDNHSLLYFGDPKTCAAYCENMESGRIITPPGGWQVNRLARAIAEQFYLPFYCRRHKIDCLVSNYVIPLFAPCKQVVVIHDMLLRRFPSTFEATKLLYWKTMIPRTIKRSDAIVAVSQFSAKEICHFFPRAKDKIFITVEGIRSSLAIQTSAIKNTQIIHKKYIICVATFGQHKNLNTLIDAFSLFPDELNDLLLVFVGSARTPDAKRYKNKLIKQIRQLRVEERVLFVEHVSDEDLAVLYKNALLCVLPSIYEGFGLPVIEAQFCGCPVICSNTASLPEVGGNAVKLFNPTSSKDIKDKIVALALDHGLQEKMRQAGVKNLKRFSWKKAAEQLIFAVENCVKNG